MASLRRVVTVGMPRSGTTLLASFLNAQAGITFRADYLGAFQEIQSRLGLGWQHAMNASQRRVALALMREQIIPDPPEKESRDS